ncbi:MAG: MFS transporter [Pseudomonadota bacterium]
MLERDLFGAIYLSSRNTIIGSIAVSIAFVMELTLVPLLLPVIQQEFALSIAELAWVFNSYGFAVALGVLLGGWMGDVFDTKKVFAAGVLFFAAGSALVAYAESYDVMIAGRVVQGFGGGVFSPLVPVLLTRASPERPGRVLIIWGSVAGYVAAFAPLFYSSFLVDFGWKLAFLILAILSLGALVVIRRSSVGNERISFTESGASYSKLFRSRGMILMFAFVFCTYGSITYYLFKLPIWLAENDFDVINIGFTLSVMWLSFSVVSTLLRNRVDEIFIRRILLVAPVLIGAGFPLAYFCGEIVCVLLASFLVGSGLACSNAPSTQVILKFAPRGTSAVSASLDITFARLGGVASVAFLAQVSFGQAVIAIIALSAVAFFCAMAIASRLAEHYLPQSN